MGLEQQFLEDIASKCGFQRRKKEVFLSRFDPQNESRTNIDLANELWDSNTNSEVPVDPRQTFQDHLRKIVNRLRQIRQNGDSIPSQLELGRGHPLQGHPLQGQEPWRQEYDWLWKTLYPQWKETRLLKDLKQLPDFSGREFFGRTENLENLTQWIVNEHPKLVVISGMAGIGKTTLVAKFVEKFYHHFDRVIWTSLRIPTGLEDFLTDFLTRINTNQNLARSDTLYSTIEQVINSFSNCRFISVIDNYETLLHRGSGNYLPEYYLYNDFLMRILESRHKSVIIITTRERFSISNGCENYIRFFKVDGVDDIAARQVIANNLNLTTFLQEEIDRLIHYVGNNPKMLEILSAHIRDVFQGNISRFLNSRRDVPIDISNLLEQVFDCLQDSTKKLMIEIAKHYQMSFTQLQNLLIPTIPEVNLRADLQLLRNRSLIHENDGKYTQHSIVREYLIKRFVDCIYNEVNRNGTFQ